MVIFQFIHLLAEIINLPDETNPITFLVELITTKTRTNQMETGETKKITHYSWKMLVSVKETLNGIVEKWVVFFLYLISNEWRKKTVDRPRGISFFAHRRVFFRFDRSSHKENFSINKIANPIYTHSWKHYKSKCFQFRWRKTWNAFAISDVSFINFVIWFSNTHSMPRYLLQSRHFFFNVPFFFLDYKSR